MSIYIGNNEISSIYIGSEPITAIYVGTDMVYSDSGDNTNYLRFTATQDYSTIELAASGSPSGITLEYSMDKENWTSWDLSAITMMSDDTVYLRGTNTAFATDEQNCYYFVLGGSFYCNGSIMTLLDPTNSSRTLSTSNTFRKLFYGCIGLLTPPSLPATTLSNNCYRQLFEGCTGLGVAPTLPATNLTEMCYSRMFYGCASLRTAPELPATTLAKGCYSSMLRNCFMLTEAPELPAKTLVENCYKEMFNGSNNLSEITTYAEDISASGCTYNWVKNVANSGTFYNKGVISYTSGYSGIPNGWIEVKPFIQKWKPTASGLTDIYGNIYSGSTWSFGTDADGDYYYNNGGNEMIPLNWDISGTEVFRIKFKYNNPDGRQLLGNAASYNDDQFTYRFFLYAGVSYDIGEYGDDMRRIATNVDHYNTLLDYEISNHYIKNYEGAMIAQDTPTNYISPSTIEPFTPNMLYVGTDGYSDIKIYDIEVISI